MWVDILLLLLLLIIIIIINIILFLLLPLGAYGIRETLVSLQFLNFRKSVGLPGRGSARRKAAT
jgi:hypothetical protein